MLNSIFHWQVLIQVLILRRSSGVTQGAGRGNERLDRRKNRFFESRVLERQEEENLPQDGLHWGPSLTHQLGTSTISCITPQNAHVLLVGVPQNQAEGGRIQVPHKGLEA